PGRRRVRARGGTSGPRVVAIPAVCACEGRLADGWPTDGEPDATARTDRKEEAKEKSAGVAPGAFVSCECRPRPAPDQKTWRTPTPKPLTFEPRPAGE